MERELREVRGSVDAVLEQVGRITGVLGDHTTTLRVMNDTLHFQVSFVGDQTESYERFTKEVNEHVKESTDSSKAQREAIEVTNERVTQRRREIDELDTLVSVCAGGPLEFYCSFAIGQGNGRLY